VANHREIASHPLSLSLAAMGMIAAMPAALAQAADAAVSTTAATEELETVYVTAQRRAERAQDVPITVTTLDTQQLEDAGVTNLGGIATVTPGLRFDSAGSFSQATIRGVGSAVVASGAGTNVGIYVDGFYSPSPLAAEFELLNINNVQVLKGPQGTLFGYNTTGGAILVTTAKPSVDTKGEVAASYGNYNAQSYEGYFTTGLTDRIAFDVAGLYRKGDGYFDDIVTGSDKDGAYENWTVRTGVKVDVTEDIWFMLRYQHARTDDPTSYLNNAYVLDGVAQVPGAAFNAVGVPAVYAQEPRDLAYAGDTRFLQEVDTYQLTASFDLGFANLTSYTQYNTIDAQSENFSIAFTALNPAPSVYVPLGRLSLPNRGSDSFTQEFLLNSTGEGRLQWTAGAFYLDWTDPFGADISLNGAPYIPTGRSSTDTVSAALFADGTYEVVDNWFLTAGLRYTHDEVKNAFFYGFPGVPNTDLPTLKNDEVTPRVVVRYTPTTDSSVYLSYSHGYKAAIYNVGGAQGDPIKPESINAFELGYKYAASGLSFDIATYFYDYKDLQVASYTVIPGTVPPTPASVVNNAANSRIYGLEAQFRYDLSSDFSINLGAAYTNAKYTEFEDSPTFTQCLDPVACGAGYGIFVSGSVDLSDADMVRSPDLTANAGARYAFDVGGGTLALAGNLYYTSKFYFDSSNVYSQKAYTLLGLRAEWTNPTERYTLALYGENVTDTEYRTVLQNTNFGIGNVWGPPAMYGAQVRVRF
jgi:iron complex outermembrane recepter protein